MRWCFAFGWLCRTWEQRHKRRPTRRWVKYLQPRLEPLEERRLFTNNVWLPQQLAAFDGTTQTNSAASLFQPATTTLLPQLALHGTSISVSGQVNLTDNGNYQLSLTQSGPYDQNGDNYTFTESGPVTFSLTELGNLSATGFSITSITLTQTAALAWNLNVSGNTVHNYSGNNNLSTTSHGGTPFDPLFPQGFNWLSLTQQVSSLNSLGLTGLSATSLSVSESSGSDSYLFQETNGVATVTGSVQAPLSVSLLQSGQDSYSDTAVECFNSSTSGSDSFSLEELGQYASNSYALNSVAYQETKGNQARQFNATVSDSQSGTGASSGMQSFSGDNHTLGDSSSESFQFSNLSTLSYGESASNNYALTEQGSYGGGSFSLSSLTYYPMIGTGGTGGYSLTQTALQTQTGSFSDSDSASGLDSFGVAGSMTDSGSDSAGGNFTNTVAGTLTDGESGSVAVSATGAYANGSWSLSSFNLSESLSGSFTQQQLGTLTQSGNATVTASGSGTDSFLLNLGASNTTTGGGNDSITDTQTDSFTLTSTSSSTQSGASSTTLSELGAWQGGSISLSSYVFTSGQNGTYTATGTGNETDTGTAQDTASDADNATETGSNGGFNENLLGSDNFVANDSYSFTSTDSSSSSDGGGFNQSVYQAGVYNHGSFALSSVVESNGANDSFADSSSDSSSDRAAPATATAAAAKTTTPCCAAATAPPPKTATPLPTATAAPSSIPASTPSPRPATISLL